MNKRYIRQEAFKYLGKKAQDRLSISRVTIVGMGALGTVGANELARAGVGFLRLIDYDRVDISNLHRQILYVENDAKDSMLKVDAAVKHIYEINSEIKTEAVSEKLTEANAFHLFCDVDLVIDATDNFEARYIINKYCLDLEIPWIYGGAVGSEGMTVNMLPNEACLGCLTGLDKPSEADKNIPKCDTMGVLNTVTATVASLQCTEALKILTGSPFVRRKMLRFDLWENKFSTFEIPKDPDCPICGRNIKKYQKEQVLYP